MTSRTAGNAGAGVVCHWAAAEGMSSRRHAAALLSLDDADLVARAVGADEEAPDPEAFGALYERHVHAVFTFALRKLHNCTQAEDVTSQTFLQALRALPRYQPQGVSIRNWFFRIASNLVADL
jgi:hypothetical protein